MFFLGALTPQTFFVVAKTRGHVSKKFPKKQFGVKLLPGVPEGQLLGLSVKEQLVLNGPYIDTSFLRNVFSFTLYRGGFLNGQIRLHGYFCSTRDLRIRE